ncbi:MAG: hypothetical protein N3A69_13600, partial [Leptospiraceae bacterium]|nr:hypothetical protein [Leptospiraceae bacterium]
MKIYEALVQKGAQTTFAQLLKEMGFGIIPNERWRVAAIQAAAIEETAEYFKTLKQEERIQEEVGGTCAYTGKPISKGEIDHILPRSYTQENYGTILDSEINLLYVSQEGNQIKKESLYTIKNINQGFLEKHFETADELKLKKKIQEILDKVLQNNQNQKIDYLQIESLKPKDRLLLKMGLFCDELRDEILKRIQTHSRTLVNGTQIWLYKKLQQTLKNLLKKEFPKSEIKIHPHYIGTSDDNFTLAQLRKTLGEYNAAYRKRDVDSQAAPIDSSDQANNGNRSQQKQGQKETSHIIDATLVFAKALVEGKESFKTPLIPDNEVLDFSSTTTAEWLESLLPEDLELVQITRKPTYRKSRPFTASIFKQGMYAERFLSLLVLKDKVKVGFTPTLSHELNLEDAEELFERLKPFLKHGKNFVDKDLEYYQNLKTPMDYVLLKIDRQKAKEHLQTCKSDDLVGQTLEGLRYVTQNKNILDDKNNISINLQNSKEFSEDFKIPNIKTGKSK